MRGDMSAEEFHKLFPPDNGRVSSVTNDYYSRWGEGVQPVDVAEAWGLGYHLGTVLKYVCRAGVKTTGHAATVRDLEKARWFLDRAIDRAGQGHPVRFL